MDNTRVGREEMCGRRGHPGQMGVDQLKRIAVAERRPVGDECVQRGNERVQVGSLVDTLHEIFAQDRTVASQGESARCGICYLHFPLAALEYREAEGFYVCAGCKRALGHNPSMMIRRQQPPHIG